MAQPIAFDSPKRNFRNELRVRLEQAPDEHAEAILAGYEVLQGLHDNGILEVVRGVLGGGDKVLGMLVDASKSPEAIRGIRSFLILLKIAGAIDPNALNATLESGRLAAPSLWEIGKRAGRGDARRGMVAALGLLGLFGQTLKERSSELVR